MADYRTVQSKIWRDEWFTEQSADAKLLFIYLFTNPAATVAGIYQLPLKFIAFDTGLSTERINEIMATFQEAKKVMWCNPTIWVRKMREYQATDSPALKTRIQRDIDNVADCDVKRQYLSFYKDGMGTVSRLSKHPNRPSKNSTGPSHNDTTQTLYDTTLDETKQPLGANAPERKLSDLQIAQSSLETQFSKLTGLDTPTKKAEAAERWWNPLGEIWRLAGKDTRSAELLMKEAMKQLTAQKMTYDSPASLVRTCRSLCKKTSPDLVAAPARVLRGPRE